MEISEKERGKLYGALIELHKLQIKASSFESISMNIHVFKIGISINFYRGYECICSGLIWKDTKDIEIKYYIDKIKKGIDEALF